MIKVLAIGDVMGKAGRRCLDQLLPKARAELQPDFIIVNGENAAGGFGLTQKLYRWFTETMEVDCVTMGNHWHDKREIYNYLPSADRLVLPANMANVDREEKGLRILTTRSGVSCAVINLLGRTFMVGENRCPFKAVSNLMERIPSSVKVIIVDMHAEATSEKQGIAQYLRNRASLVYGTHSHVPTADERLLGTTGFVTDLGMTGGYDSIIGIRTDAALRRLTTGEKHKFEPATEDPRLYAILATIDESTGHCSEIKRIIWPLS